MVFRVVWWLFVWLVADDDRLCGKKLRANLVHGPWDCRRHIRHMLAPRPGYQISPVSYLGGPHQNQAFPKKKPTRNWSGGSQCCASFLVGSHQQVDCLHHLLSPDAHQTDVPSPNEAFQATAQFFRRGEGLEHVGNVFESLDWGRSGRCGNMQSVDWIHWGPSPAPFFGAELGGFEPQSVWSWNMTEHIEPVNIPFPVDPFHALGKCPGFFYVSHHFQPIFHHPLEMKTPQ